MPRDTKDHNSEKSNSKTDAVRFLDNEYRLDAIVNGYNGFIYLVSKDYKIEFMNKTLIDYAGYDATGSYCFNLLHGLDKRCPWCVRDKVFSGESTNFEHKSPKDNRWYYYVSTPMINPKGEVIAQQLIAIDIHDRKQIERKLEKKEQQLKQEILLLKSTAINQYGLDEIVGQSKKMQKVYNLILEVASSDASILIYGESGTGKELVAKAIHNLGPHKAKPFLPVNCGGIPDNLIESEFFGYKKGAFTGANIDKAGFLEISDGGTLFLDEIGEINLNMQVKLLRAIDGDGYTPLGSNRIIKPKVRILSATNKDLNDFVAKGFMRSDFFYRINVIPLYLPPLRERRDDIPLLIYHFLKKFSSRNSLPHLPHRIMHALEQYDWPGNVRELQNIIHRYVTLNRLDVFNPFLSVGWTDDSSEQFAPDFDDPLVNLQDAMKHYEKKILLHYLKKNQWNQSKAASTLGINRKTLYSKIKKYSISNV